MAFKTLPFVKVDTDTLVLNGGLDLVTPPLRQKSGSLRFAQNFEQNIDGGYRRIAGYERYDGEAAPSDAEYTVLNATSITGGSVGDTLTGAGGATGKIIAVTATYFVLTQRNATAYVDGENLNVGAGTIAVASGTGSVGGASTALLRATYQNAAADIYRALIDVVPGTGIVRGVVQYNDVVYAFRNRAGNVYCDLYKSTASGWSQVSLGRELYFNSGGTYVIAEGDVIVGAISGATATVTRVVLESGSFAAGTAAGRLIFASDTGTFQAENLDVGANLNVATTAVNSVATYDSEAISLLANGTYEFIIENFGGTTNTKRVYGCDGVNRGFEFDGTVFVPIDTGMTTDTPTHVHAHLKQLFFSFVGSVQHSAPGTPYIWSAVLGATEIAMGDTVTGFAGQPGSSTAGALAIFTRNKVSILYGTGVASWVLVPYRDELGAFARTIQNVGKTVFLDDRGITDLQTSQSFGNFAHAVLSNKVRPLVSELLVSAVSSCICRERNQYRLFFTGGEALYMTFADGKLIGTTEVVFPDPVRCVWSGEQNDGSEAIFFGTDSGYVMQMEKGTSFDGAAINFRLDMAYSYCGNPRMLKHFRHTMLEIEGSSYVAFNFGYSLGYNTTEIDQPAEQAATANLSSSSWDAAGVTWDSVFWDGQTLIPSELAIGGDATNYSLSISGVSDIYEPFTITGAITHYTNRRLVR